MKTLPLAVIVGLFACITPTKAQQAQPTSFIGTWHQPRGLSGCGGSDAYEAYFTIASVAASGDVTGTYQIYCINASGTFAPGTKSYGKIGSDQLQMFIGPAVYTIGGDGRGMLNTEHYSYPLGMQKQ